MTLLDELLEEIQRFKTDFHNRLRFAHTQIARLEKSNEDLSKAIMIMSKGARHEIDELKKELHDLRQEFVEHD